MTFDDFSQPGPDSADPLTVPVVDPAFYHEMVGVVGEEAFSSILETFHPVANELTDELAAAIAAKDADARKEAAHSLKGSAANVGATRAAALCQTLETCSQDEAEQLLAPLKDALAQTPAAFKALGS